jgi:centromeric protein E
MMLQVASTAYNDQSSRSHTICRLLVESSPRQRSAADAQASAAAGSSGSGGGGSSGSSGSVTCTSAWLTLVDLAGSEGAKAALSKDQQAEARDINRSLLTLGKVMYELAKGGSGSQGHLPFRDSLLTRLLKVCVTREVGACGYLRASDLAP